MLGWFGQYAVSILSRLNPACLIVGLMLAWCWATFSLQHLEMGLLYNQSPTETQSMKH